MNSLIEKQKLRIKDKYPYLSVSEIEICLDYALSDYLSIIYRGINVPPIETLDIGFTHAMWLYKRMDDILSRAGGTNVTGYRENGINFSYGASYIDPALARELLPNASVPK